MPEPQQRVDKIISKITSPDEIEPQVEEHYHVIKISAKRYETEQENVHVVSSAGKRDYDFRMRREELIPVPDGICEVLDQARHPQYRMPTSEELLEGKKEKIVGYVQRYPYEKVFRDIPKEVYMILKKRASDPKAKPITEKEIQEMLKGRKN